MSLTELIELICTAPGTSNADAASMTIDGKEYNDRQQKVIEPEQSDLGVQENLQPTGNKYQSLLGQWQQKKTEKSQPKIKERKLHPNHGKSGKCLDKSEVWPADRIRTVKESSQMGRVLVCMFRDGGIRAEQHESLELTRGQFVQAIGSISEAGYGIANNDGLFTVILPDGMDSPKLK